MTAPAFKRGDLVRWSSQGRGVLVHHVGIVVLEVPAFVPVAPLLDAMGHRYSLRAVRHDAGLRPEPSLLVALLGQGKRGKARLHWPRTELLRPYTAEATDAAA